MATETILDADEGPLVVSVHSFNINHTYGVGEIGNVYNVKVKVDDGDPLGVGFDIFQVTVVDNTFRVTGLTATPSGFVAQFNRAADTTVLNIYDGIDIPADLPDITLVGNLRWATFVGSAVWTATTNTLEFVRTGGVLAADTYTVTLVSSADAFNDTLRLAAGRRFELCRRHGLRQWLRGHAIDRPRRKFARLHPRRTLGATAARW